MKTRSASSALPLCLALAACGGAPDGSRSPEESTGTNEQALRAIGSTFATPTTTVASPLRPIVGVVVPVVPITTIVTAPPPPDADLRADGAMRYYGADPSQPTEGLQIDVMNVGTTPANGPSGRLSINGVVFSTALYQYYGGTATTPNTLNPGERGYLTADVPYGFLTDCQPYTVDIDLDQTLQSGPNVFANDTRVVVPYHQDLVGDQVTGTVCPLNWTTPINAATLGYVADPLEDGKSLQDIVSSIEIARSDGLRCSTCHNPSFPTSTINAETYQPNVAAGVPSAPIDPFQFIGGNEGWACGANPWARQFITMTNPYTKPLYLRNAFQKWLTDGGLR